MIPVQHTNHQRRPLIYLPELSQLGCCPLIILETETHPFTRHVVSIRTFPDTMGWLLALFFVVILVAAVIVCVLLHAGFFSDLRIRTSVPASLPSRIAYKVYRGGPYSKVGGSLSTLSAIAPKQTLLCIFYDDPKKVSQWHVENYSSALSTRVVDLPCPLCIILYKLRDVLSMTKQSKATCLRKSFFKGRIGVHLIAV